MKHPYRNASFAFAGVMTALILIGAAAAAGVRVNTTHSIPVGLYMVSDAPVRKDAYVLVCPPDDEIFATAKSRGYISSGFCDGRYGYLMKRVKGLANDTITVADNGVSVNDELLPLSVPVAADDNGAALPLYRANGYVLGVHQVLLMGDDSPLSFDARYYGPLDVSQIQTVIEPFFTW